MRSWRTGRRLTVTAAAVAVAFGLSACGSTDDLDGDDAGGGGGNTDSGTSYSLTAADSLPASVQAIKDKGKIVVGTKYDQPGFGQQNPSNQELEGFDTEIARLLAIRIFGDASKVEFRESKTAVREQFIQNGTVDAVVATYTINDKRKEVISFAGPYFVAGQDILVKKDNTDITSVEDLNGKSVCTLDNSTSLDYIPKPLAPQAKVTFRDSYAVCAEEVADGQFDALTTDNVILLGLVSKRPDDLKVVGKPFSEEPYGIGVKKDATEFRNFVNDFLEEIYTNGDWVKAYDKTAGQFLGEAPEPPKVDRYPAS